LAFIRQALLPGLSKNIRWERLSGKRRVLTFLPASPKIKRFSGFAAMPASFGAAELFQIKRQIPFEAVKKTFSTAIAGSPAFIVFIRI
jgi:hypothetical protein